MTLEHPHQDDAAHAPNRVGDAAPGPHHTHDHAHRHEHAHGAHAHTHAPASPERTQARISLLMHSASLRLAGAVALSALLWAAVAWSLSGTP